MDEKKEEKKAKREEKSVFRKKSLDRISSPEQLNDYIRVSSPGIWILLAAVIILLIGIGVWAVFGTMETRIPVCVISDGSESVCYIHAEDRDSLNEKMILEIGDMRSLLGEISVLPDAVNEYFPEYALHVGNLKVGEWVYTVKLFLRLPEGIYPANIITEEVKPLSFIFS